MARYTTFTVVRSSATTPCSCSAQRRGQRSWDLADWESSPLNPVLRYSDEDKIIASTDLTAEQRAYIAATKIKKTSDLDLCEFEGKTGIYYSWGGNAGRQFLAQAEYDGALDALLTSFFPTRSDETESDVK